MNGDERGMNRDVPGVAELTGPAAGQVIEAALQAGVDARFLVTGASMAPRIRSGDTVTVRPAAASSVRVGDVVFCRRGDGPGYLMHRVLLRRRVSGRRVLRTKGDALLSLDPLVRDEHLLGIVVADASGRGVSSRWIAWCGLIRVFGCAIRNRLRRVR